MELDDHLIERTAYARLSLTIGSFVSLRQKEVPYERIVYNGLQYNAHKARLSHVVEPT